MSNALKFSFPKSIVKIAVVARNSEITIMVQDKGIGIPPMLIDQVFEPYTPTSRTGTCQEKGTGFGMPLAKSILDKIGGTIDIESSENPPNNGTTMKVSLRRYI